MSREDEVDRIRTALRDSAEAHAAVAREQTDRILAGVDIMAGALSAGNKIMFCGNGGSAADAQHLATELTSRFSPELQRPALGGLALTTDTSFLTAHTNDFGFTGVFRRQLEGVGEAGDVLVGISTSGQSANVLKAVELAGEMGIDSIGLTGQSGGELAGTVDLSLTVPSRDTQRIQEVHIAIGHILVELTEKRLHGEPAE